MAFGLDDAINEGLKLINKWVPDPLEKAKAEAEYVQVMAQLKTAQIGLNTAEVQSGHWLGKWRGALGWALVASMLYQFILYPFLVAGILAVDHTFPVERLPVLEWKQLGSLLLGMLGLGG